jgi:hypothetical protein
MKLNADVGEQLTPEKKVGAWNALAEQFQPANGLIKLGIDGGVRRSALYPIDSAQSG